jgi:hypothetical protein
MPNRISGYDPNTSICWRFGNKGDNYWRHKCPGCSAECSLIMFGRCRSGRRWFWQAFNSTQTNVRFHQTNVWTKIEEHGFEDTEEAAWASACAAVVHLAKDSPPLRRLSTAASVRDSRSLTPQNALPALRRIRATRT